MRVELEYEDIKNIENLIISRITELRGKLVDDGDNEEELREIIRYYKKLIEKIENEIQLNENSIIH